MLPGDWDLAHAIRLGIKPFAELGANLEALSGSQVDSPCSCRAIFESAPVAMLQSRKENPNQLPLSVSLPGATPARRVGSFRGYAFVMIFLAVVIYGEDGKTCIEYDLPVAVRAVRRRAG
jgi:hypothetical protein